MPKCCPSRRFFLLPAWLWLILPVPLFWTASGLPQRWPPEKLAEPPERHEIFRDGVFVTRDVDAFRFIPFASRKDVQPVWDINVMTRDHSNITWNASFLGTGMFQLHSQWTYELTSYRSDNDWKNEQTGEFMLSKDDMRRLWPRVVEELNQRDASKKLGDRLTALVDNGLERSSQVCVQNGITLSAWLSLPFAVVSAIMMFVPRRAKVELSGAA